jgi:hypothetical protein
VPDISRPNLARRQSRSSRDGESLQKRVWRAENAFHILTESRCFIRSIVARSRKTCAQTTLSGRRSSVTALSYSGVHVFSPRRVFYGFTPQHCTFPDWLASVRESVTTEHSEDKKNRNDHDCDGQPKPVSPSDSYSVPIPGHDHPIMFLNILKETMLMIVATRSLKLLLSGVGMFDCSFRRSMNSANEIPPGTPSFGTKDVSDLLLSKEF